MRLLRNPKFSLTDSYEVILIADGFAPDKILPAAFDELLRVLRPGKKCSTVIFRETRKVAIFIQIPIPLLKRSKG